MKPNRARVAEVLARRGQHLVFDAVGSAGPQVEKLLAELPLSPAQRAYFLEGEFKYLGLAETSREEKFARFGAYLPDLPAEARISEWGVGALDIKSADGFHAGYKSFHPLQKVDSLAELEKYPFPDLAAEWRQAGLAERVADCKALGFTVVGNMSQTILENAYLMRGMEELMIDLYESPDYAATLFARLAEQRTAQAVALARAGVDVLRIGDDICTQQGLLVSLDTYREFIRPHHEAVIAAARAVTPGLPVLYHSDGNIRPILPDLIAAGVTAINPVQPECLDMPALQREFGRDVTLWGCCPVQSTYAWGTREDILAHLRLLREELAPLSGCVVQFYNMIITPPLLQNLRIFYENFALA